MTKHVILSIPDDLYHTADDQAHQRGKKLNDYLLGLIQGNLDSHRSFAQKNGAGKKVSGTSIIEHHDLVNLNGIYYHYRFLDRDNDDLAHRIESHRTYYVLGLDGNVAVLTPLK